MAGSRSHYVLLMYVFVARRSFQAVVLIDIWIPTAGNMGNYPQEASGYGPQRVNYNQPHPNFNQPQGKLGFV